ncbi:hypothetical protein OE88DRAFT_1233696 [Heliocybe sulcata]|uniref:Uncharacterized protein n=1 Tax=Heliocybe sulcata TaxID=5364 RepID=A0A5C3N7I6_9AGAM|nr:hypothetical protein OE88DRAFT_1233696 [Heliocybe sulcata]
MRSCPLGRDDSVGLSLRGLAANRARSTPSSRAIPVVPIVSQLCGVFGCSSLVWLWYTMPSSMRFKLAGSDTILPTETVQGPNGDIRCVSGYPRLRGRDTVPWNGKLFGTPGERFAVTRYHHAYQVQARMQYYC